MSKDVNVVFIFSISLTDIASLLPRLLAVMKSSLNPFIVALCLHSLTSQNQFRDDRVCFECLNQYHIVCAIEFCTYSLSPMWFLHVFCPFYTLTHHSYQVSLFPSLYFHTVLSTPYAPFHLITCILLLWHASFTLLFSLLTHVSFITVSAQFIST